MVGVFVQGQTGRWLHAAIAHRQLLVILVLVLLASCQQRQSPDYDPALFHTAFDKQIQIESLELQNTFCAPDLSLHGVAAFIRTNTGLDIHYVDLDDHLPEIRATFQFDNIATVDLIEYFVRTYRLNLRRFGQSFVLYATSQSPRPIGSE